MTKSPSLVVGLCICKQQQNKNKDQRLAEKANKRFLVLGGRRLKKIAISIP